MVDTSQTIGFVGLGAMGEAMAGHITRAGHRLVVWNRTPERAVRLEVLGAEVAPSAADVGDRAAVILVCVSDSRAVDEVVFGRKGVLAHRPANRLVVDCSTISPEATRRFARKAARRQGRWVDAPMSGGVVGAEQGSLSVFVGAPRGDFEEARSILECFASAVTHCGPLGSGQATKAVNQVMLAGTMLGVAEGLVLAMKVGLDPRTTVEALARGAAGSWVLSNSSNRVIVDQYPPGFKVELHRKDLAIALDLARQANVAMPGAALFAQLQTALVATGRGTDDFSAIAHVLRHWSGLSGER